MSSTNESNNSNLFKYITIAISALIVIGVTAWYIVSINSKHAAAEAALSAAKSEINAKNIKQAATEEALLAAKAEIDSQNSKQAAIEAALTATKAELTAQNNKQAATEAALSAVKAEINSQKSKEAANVALRGKKSAEVYDEYMKQTVLLRVLAYTLRTQGEHIQTNLMKNPQLGGAYTFDIKQIIATSAQYYDKAASIGSSVDFRDLDPDLVEYITRNREMDLELKKIYDDYSATGRKPDEELAAYSSKRKQLIEKNEQSLISKFKNEYGLSILSFNDFQKDSNSKLKSQSEIFSQSLTPSRVAQRLIGKVFTNTENNTKWRLGSSEFTEGSFEYMKAVEGVVVVSLNMQVRNPRTNFTGRLSAMVFYAKPTDESVLEWPIIFAVCP